MRRFQARFHVRTLSLILFLSLALSTPAVTSGGDTGYVGKHNPSLVYPNEADSIETLSWDVDLIGWWPEGPCYAVEPYGNLACVGNGAYLEVIDFSNPSMPQKLGSVRLHDKIWDIVVSGTLAYVANGSGGLRIVDISVPSSPVEIGHFDKPPGTSYDLAIAGNYAYMADGVAGLRIVDITDPTDPVEVADLYDLFDDWAYANGVAVRGDFVFVVGYGMSVYNATYPHDPGRVAVVGNEWDTEDIVTGGDFAYVAARDDGLRIINISNPSVPTEVGHYIGDPPYEVGTAYSVDMSGNYVYVGSFYPGFTVVDVTDPANPVGVVSSGHGSWNLRVWGNRLYQACESYGVWVTDITVPSYPTALGSYAVPDGSYDVAVHNGYAYLANTSDGVRILDVSTPALPVEVGLYEGISYAYAVAISESHENIIYAADGSQGLHIIDVQNPASPFEVGFYDTDERVVDVTASDTLCYLADRDGGLRIINVSDPANPNEIGFLLTGGPVAEVEIQGTYAYLLDYINGLIIVDISDPTHPLQVGAFDAGDVIYGIAVSGDYAYLARGYQGIRIVNVSTPSAPFSEAIYGGAGYTADLEIVGDYAYGAGFLSVIDLSDPVNPIRLGYYDISYGMDVAVSGGYIYALSFDVGLYVLAYPSNVAEPQIHFVTPTYWYPDASTPIRIEGSDFIENTTVDMGEGIILDVTFESPLLLTGEIQIEPSAVPGPRDVIVFNASPKSDTLVAGFEIRASTSHYVSSAGADVYPYVTPENAAVDIADAIGAAIEGDSILIASGTISHSSFVVDRGVNVYGAWINDFTDRDLASGKTLLDLSGNVVISTTDPMVFDGFILENGTGSYGTDPQSGYYGGGILILNSTATISNCEIRSCQAMTGGNFGAGGGIAGYGSTVDIHHNNIWGNSAEHGGGIYLYGCGGTVDNNIISGNQVHQLTTTPYGAGFYLENSTGMSMNGNTIHANTGANDGGGIYITNSNDVSVSGGTLSYNQSTSSGGGVSLYKTDAFFEGVRFFRNQSALFGGAVSTSDTATVTVASCDFKWNRSTLGAAVSANTGAFYVRHNLFVGNNASLTGGVFYGTSLADGIFIGNTLDRNTGGSGAGGIMMSGCGIEVFNNIIVNSVGTGISCSGSPLPTIRYNDVWNSSASDYDGCGAGEGSISADPLFADTSLADYHLTIHSPGIDAGDTSSAYNDPDGSRGDMGWYGSHSFVMDQPSRPRNFEVSINAGETVLHWSPNPELDVLYFALYDDTVEHFVPSLQNFVQLFFASDTSYNAGPAVHGTYYKLSAIDSSGYAGGYAGPVEVDLVAPAKPTEFGGTYNVSTNELFLKWSRNTESDVSHYVLHKGEGEGFIPSDLNRIAETPDTFVTFTQGSPPAEPWYYKLAALDDNGNTSEYTVLAPSDITVPTLLLACEANWHRNSVEVNWLLTSDSNDATFKIFRRCGEAREFEAMDVHVTRRGDFYRFSDETVGFGLSYTYLVEIYDSGSLVSMFRVSVKTPLLRTALEQNYPNPFNPTTTIPFTLAERGHVFLSIYTADGKLVRTLVNRPMEAGYREVQWDGRDTHGNPVSSGVYLYRLKANKTVHTKKMVFLK